MNLVWRRRAGGAVWVAGVLVALLGGWASRGGVEAPALGHAPSAVIAVAESGRVVAIDVGLHQQVQAGDVVAKLDDEPLQAALQVAQAELLVAQEEAAISASNEARRFAEGREDAALDRARAMASLAEARANLAATKERLAIAESLVADGAGAAGEVLRLRQARDLARAQVEAWSVAVAEADAADQAASLRATDRPSTSQWQVVAATRRVEALELRVERSTLRAPRDGQVRWVHRSPGDIVSPGEPILEIQPEETDEVMAWLRPGQAGALQAGAAAQVIRTNGALLKGRLVSMGASPRQLPKRLWHNPAQPEWGVPARVRLEGGTVTPDESLVVRL